MKVVSRPPNTKKYNIPVKPAANDSWDGYVDFEETIDPAKRKAYKQREAARRRQSNKAADKNESDNSFWGFFQKAFLLNAGCYCLNKVGMMHDQGSIIISNMPATLLGAAGYSLGKWLDDQSRRWSIALCGVGIVAGMAIKYDLPEKFRENMQQKNESSMMKEAAAHLFNQTNSEIFAPKGNVITVSGIDPKP